MRGLCTAGVAATMAWLMIATTFTTTTSLLVLGSPACSDFPNCKSCVAAFSERCGWCSGQCLEGTVNGSSNGACNTTATIVRDSSITTTPSPTAAPAASAPWHWHGFQCPAAIDCTQYVSCQECASNFGCGWCGDANKCLSGTPTGPSSSSSTCSNLSWHWNGEKCPTAAPGAPTAAPPAHSGCAGYSVCSACALSELSCGWCDGKCLPGNKMGPVVGSCHNHTWSWELQSCPTPCDEFGSCDECAWAGSHCGWCNGQCIRGNATGPSTVPGAPQGSCNNTSWHYSGGLTCPKPPSSCHRHTSCIGCTDSFSGECGFCGGASGTCMDGNASGPLNNNSCPSGEPWHWVGLHCPARPTAPPTPLPSIRHDCSQYTDCSDCTVSESNSCGWCVSSGTNGQCLPGNNASGPTGGSGATCNREDWHFWGYQCPTPPPTPQPAGECARLSDCTSCVMSELECGFCSSDKLCSAGGSSGPRNTTCSGVWQTSFGECPAP